MTFEMSRVAWYILKPRPAGQEDRHDHDRRRVAELQPDVEQVVPHLALVRRAAHAAASLVFMTPSRSAFSIRHSIYPPCDLKKCPRSSASWPADASRQSRRALSLSRGREPDCRLAPALVQHDDALRGPARHHHLDVAVRLRGAAADDVVEARDVAVDVEARASRSCRSCAGRPALSDSVTDGSLPSSRDSASAMIFEASGPADLTPPVNGPKAR